MAPHSSTPAWKIPWTEKPGRLQSMGLLSQTWLSDFTFTFHFHAFEKEMATHSSVLAWRIPGTAEPGGLLSMGFHRVRHDWRNLAAAAEQLKRRWLELKKWIYTYIWRKNFRQRTLSAKCKVCWAWSRNIKKASVGEVQWKKGECLEDVV